MSVAFAKNKNLHISTQKLELILELIRKRPAKQALEILALSHKRAAFDVMKTLKSAINNAEKKSLVIDDMIIIEAYAGSSMKLKRRKTHKAVKMKRMAPRRKMYSNYVIKIDNKNNLKLNVKKDKKIKDNKVKLKTADIKPATISKEEV
ncbi:MAG: uL22 family ribosomal protein [Alphaproteobacteria bacterium]|nr:uL22 family ribosomal protein [Alphaproteobacteria bacterium]MBL0718170.1 uL22 family ribosomal protein [Alphaproteobacteria bacterium]